MPQLRHVDPHQRSGLPNLRCPAADAREQGTTSGVANAKANRLTVWYAGASTTAGGAFPNSGIKTTINVAPQSTGGNVWAQWVAEAMINGPTGHEYWAQVGYYYQGSTPVALAQCWDLTTYAVLPNSSQFASVTTGNHEFAFYWSGSGTTWNFAVDGRVFFTFDLGATSAYSGYPVQNLVEEQANATFPFNTVNVPVCFSVLQGGVWVPVTTASAGYTNAYYSTEGQLQNSSLAANSINIGSSVPQIGGGTTLWSGTGGGSGGGGGGTPLSVSGSLSPNSGAAPLFVAFSGLASGGTGPYSFLWNFGDGTSSAFTQSSHTYNGVGNYTATLTATDSVGATASQSIAVVVSAPATNYQVTFTEVGLPSGTVYKITIDGIQYAASAGGPLTRTLASGNHTYSYQNRVRIGGHVHTNYCTNAGGTILVAGASSATATYVPC